MMVQAKTRVTWTGSRSGNQDRGNSNGTSTRVDPGFEVILQYLPDVFLDLG